MTDYTMPVLSEQEREELIEKCKAAIVSLTPWRGVSEAKSRICFEIALASLTAKPYGYVAESPCSSGYGGMMHEFSIDRRDVEEDAAEHEGFVITLYASPPVPVKQEGEQ